PAMRVFCPVIRNSPHIITGALAAFDKALSGARVVASRALAPVASLRRATLWVGVSVVAVTIGFVADLATLYSSFFGVPDSLAEGIHETLAEAVPGASDLVSDEEIEENAFLRAEPVGVAFAQVRAGQGR